MRRLLITPIYWLEYVIFGGGALGLSTTSMLLLWLPKIRGVHRLYQYFIHLHARLWVWCLRIGGIGRIRYTGFENAPKGGCLYVANHPDLMDVLFVLGKIPRAVSVFKSDIRKNLFLGPTARLAGYVPSDSGMVDTVHIAAQRFAEGTSLIIFPEGTRTRATGCGEFKPGFALIARRTKAPLCLIALRMAAPYLSKDRDWWRIPQTTPFDLEVRFIGVMPVTDDMSNDDVSREARRRIMEHLDLSVDFSRKH